MPTLKRKLERRGRPRLYDWAALFRLGRFELTAELDYRCSQSAIVQQIRSAASKHDYKIVSLLDTGMRVLVEVKRAP